MHTWGEAIRLQVNDRVLHACQFGPDSSEGTQIPVVCIHGWLDNLESFAPLVEAFNNTVSGFCLDLTGHGASDPYPASVHDVTVLDWVLDVFCASEHLTKTPCLLVGHSLGAGLCALLAGLIPEKVLGLVLLDGLVPIPANEESFRDRFREAIEKRAALAGKKQRTYGSIEEIVDARVRAGDVDRNLARRIVKRNVIVSDGRYQWATDPRLKLPTVGRLTPGQIDSVLPHIRCPVTLIKATRRQMNIDESLFQRFAGLIPQLVVHEMPTGHYPHAERPHEIARFIKEMLEKISQDKDTVSATDY
jgi:pimeloyl-ACP methyl ester carboxylesterase